MEHAAVMAWSGRRWRLSEPVTVCRASTTEPALSGRGYLWCECFTVVCPAGEFRHVQEARRLPLSAPEFGAARRALREGDDTLVELWLMYRLDAVRDELPDPQAATSSLSANSLGSPDSRTWAATDSAS